jgi:hypothetical protein
MVADICAIVAATWRIDKASASLAEFRSTSHFVKGHLEFASRTAHEHQRALPRSHFPALLDEAIAHGAGANLPAVEPLRQRLADADPDHRSLSLRIDRAVEARWGGSGGGSINW